MLKKTSLKILEKTINRFISLDPFTPEKFSELNGKTFCIDMSGLNKKVFAKIINNKFKLENDIQTTVDATISGTPAALLKMGIKDDVISSVLAGEVKITGNVHLGKKIKKIISEMDIDWEEHLSVFTGDIVAHRAASIGRKMKNWGKRAVSSFSEDVSDYLLEESRVAITKHELDNFYSNVDSLRDETDKLQLRISRLS